MDVYTKSQQKRYINKSNRWTRSATNLPTQKRGTPCSTREVSRLTVALTSTLEDCPPKDIPTYFLDVLLEWSCTWMWDNAQLIGDEDWIEAAIRDGTL